MNPKLRIEVEMTAESGRSVCPSSPIVPVSTLRVEVGCPYESPRPDCWDELPGFLNALGFEVDQDLDGSAEIFAPTSFFSARAVIGGAKTYSDVSVDAAQRDVERVRSFLARPRGSLLDATEACGAGARDSSNEHEPLTAANR